MNRLTNDSLTYIIAIVVLFLITGFEFTNMNPASPDSDADEVLRDTTIDERFAQENLIPYWKEGLWGYSDLRGKMKIPPSYQFASLFDVHGYAITMRGDEYFIIDKNGQTNSILNDTSYSEKGFTNLKRLTIGENLFCYVAENENGEFLVIDTSLNIIIQTKEEIASVSPDYRYATVARGVKNTLQRVYSVINTNNEILFPWELVRVVYKTTPNNNGKHAFQKISKSKSSFVDEKGELILDQEYQLYKILTIGDTFCHLFVNESGGDLFTANLNLIYENIDRELAQNPELFYELKKQLNNSTALTMEVIHLSTNLSCFVDKSQQDCYCEILDGLGKRSYYKNGQLIKLEEPFELYQIIEAGAMICWNKDSKKYFITDYEGEVILPETKGRFTTVGRKELGIINRDTVHVFNLKGEEVYYYFEATYYSIQKHKDGKQAPHMGDRIPLTEFIYDEIRLIDHDKMVFYCRRDGEFFFVDSLGNELVKFKYENIEQISFGHLSPRLIKVYNDNHVGVISSSGEEIVKPIFDSIFFTSKSDIRMKSLIVGIKEDKRRTFFTSIGEEILLDEAYQEITDDELVVNFSFFNNDNYFSLEHPEGFFEFFTPQGKKVPIAKDIKSYLIDDWTAGFGVFQVNEKRPYYFINYRTGFVYADLK